MKGDLTLEELISYFKVKRLIHNEWIENEEIILDGT